MTTLRNSMHITELLLAQAGRSLLEGAKPRPIVKNVPKLGKAATKAAKRARQAERRAIDAYFDAATTTPSCP